MVKLLSNTNTLNLYFTNRHQTPTWKGKLELFNKRGRYGYISIKNVDDDKWSDIIFVVSVCEISPEPAIRVPTLLSCWVRNLEKDKQQEFKFQAPPAYRDYHAIIWCGHPSFFVPWGTRDSQCNRPQQSLKRLKKS